MFEFRVITAEVEGGSGTGGDIAGTGQSGVSSSGVSNGINNASGIAGSHGSSNAGAYIIFIKTKHRWVINCSEFITFKYMNYYFFIIDNIRF